MYLYSHEDKAFTSTAHQKRPRCLSLEFVKVNLALISSFNKIKCLLFRLIYSSQRPGFSGVPMLYFPRTFCHVLHPVINSIQHWPWFTHNPLPHTARCVLLNEVFFIPRSKDFLITFFKPPLPPFSCRWLILPSSLSSLMSLTSFFFHFIISFLVMSGHQSD